MFMTNVGKYTIQFMTHAGKCTIHWASGYVTLVIFVVNIPLRARHRKASIFLTRPRGVLISKLGGGFKYFFIFTRSFGEDEPILTHFFSMMGGWNHQLEKNSGMKIMDIFQKVEIDAGFRKKKTKFSTCGGDDFGTENSHPMGWMKSSPWNCFTKPLGFQTPNPREEAAWLDPQRPSIQTPNLRRYDWKKREHHFGENIWWMATFFRKHRREANLGGKIPRNAASFYFSVTKLSLW